MEQLHNKQHFLHFSGGSTQGQVITPPTNLPIYYNSIGLGIEFNPKNSTKLIGVQSSKVHYMICGICNNELDDPVLLNCFHSFCSNCIATRILDNEVACYSCK